MNFPLFNTKQYATGKEYDLNDPAGRHSYFHDKLGAQIEELKEFLDTNTFVAFMLAKKSAGKGTYSKMFQEIFGQDRSEVISVGDLVRKVHKLVESDPKEKADLEEYLNKNYRGFMPVSEAIEALLGRSQSKLLPTEFILTLVKREIQKVGRKAIFIDGLPRSGDQISYALYFREIINFRDDPDFFVLIDVPTSIIDERMKFRLVCPLCNTSRNKKLLPTKFIVYDKDSQQYNMLCDNSSCSGFGKEQLVEKEGDKQGIEPIKDRLLTDGELMNLVQNLHGVPKALVRNSIPVDKANDVTEHYEITPEYVFEHTENGEVIVKETPWIVKDDDGVDSYSLLAAAAVASMIYQIHGILLGNK